MSLLRSQQVLKTALISVSDVIIENYTVCSLFQRHVNVDKSLGLNTLHLCSSDFLMSVIPALLFQGIYYSFLFAFPPCR